MAKQNIQTKVASKGFSDTAISIVLIGVVLFITYMVGLSIGRSESTLNPYLAQVHTWVVCMVLAVATTSGVLHFLPKVPVKKARILIATLLAITTLLHTMSLPGLSTDYYRYLWQGRVSNSGGDNYSARPWDGGTEKYNKDLFERMDWKHVKTVYPPYAEAYYTMPAAILDSPSLSRLGFANRIRLSKLPTTAIFLVCGAVLCLLTKRKEIGLLWVSNPLIMFEFVGSAHIDVLALLFSLLAIYLISKPHKRWIFLSGVCLGVAFMVKLTPIMLAPPLIAYLLSARKYRYAGLWLFGLLASIAPGLSDFLKNDFALIDRMRYWASGAEFRFGNPFYPIGRYVVSDQIGDMLKILALIILAGLLLRIFRKVRAKTYNYTTMLMGCASLSLLPLLASPVVLQWYWITPLTLLLVVASDVQLRKQHFMMALTASTTLLIAQYLGQSTNAGETTRTTITVTTSLGVWTIVIAYLSKVGAKIYKAETIL